mmetsp:Transcript_17506/g.14283  ORF Transcript_17506/g.14283 Transcript_17506/m.14283 type:complete len:100 (+) Transcript_17506:194-493(+)
MFDFIEKNNNKKIKNIVIDKVSVIIKELRPSCTILIFGSHATGLSLPESDVDLVIMGIIDDKMDFLRQLQTKFISSELAYTCEFRDKASVPLIKYLDKE